MGNSGWTANPAQILIPPDADTDESRIVVGGPDAVAEDLSQDAAVVFYFGYKRAFILSVEQSGGPDVGQLHLWSIDPVNTTLHQILDITHDVATDDVQVRIGQQGVSDTTVGGHHVNLVSAFSSDETLDVDLRAFSVSLPRGPRYVVSTNVDSAAIGTTQTTVLSISDITYRARRAYAVSFGTMTDANTANASAFFRIQNGSGTDLGEFGRYSMGSVANNPHNTAGTIYVANRSDADITSQTLNLLMAASTGTVRMRGLPATSRYLSISDAGTEGDFPQAVTL